MAKVEPSQVVTPSRRCWLLFVAWMSIMVLGAGGSMALAQDDDVDSQLDDIGQTLDAFHAAAATGAWQRYFDLLSEDAIFLGTDASERWDKPTFQAYASTRSGWRYTSRERHINLTPDGNSAWFDELLDSASYGTSRGTGVLIRTGEGWKIAQYHLTFPIPNPLADRITDEIKAFEARSEP